MDIEKISKLKNGKYKIILKDDIIITYDDVIIKYNILYKKNISLDLIEKIKKETFYYDSYNQVLNYVLKKIRCTNEVNLYINKFGLTDDYKNSIINKLVNLNLIDDRMYANCYINDKLIFSKDSINKIKNNLLENKIEADIINEEIEKFQINEYDRLKKMILKKINSNKKYSSYKLQNKIVSDMLNLGYNYDDIIDIYEENSKDDYELLLKEYNKLYNKLSTKYEGKELMYKIKSSLYSKGFNYDAIKKEDLI